MSLFDDVEFLFSRSDKDRAEKHRKSVEAKLKELHATLEELELESMEMEKREAAYWAEEDAKNPLADILSEIQLIQKAGLKKVSA